MKHSHFGCYAIITHDYQIALIKKARGPYTGLLDLPGGTPDFGEHPIETVIREIQEELGLHASDPTLLYEDSVVYEYTQGGESCQLHHTGLIYNCKVESIKLDKAGDGLDSNGGIWVDMHHAPLDSLTPFAINAIQYIKQASN